MKEDIYDFMICPHCGGDDVVIYGTDEIEFDNNNTGHYYVDCFCKDCQKYFRLYLEFNYTITKGWTR